MKPARSRWRITPNTGDPLFIIDEGALRGRSSAFLILTTGPARVSRVECRVSYKKQRLRIFADDDGLCADCCPMRSEQGQLDEGMMIGAGLAFNHAFLVYGSPIAILPILMAVPAICVTFLCGMD